MPDGSPVLKGYTHDGWRLVRKRKGSRRPRTRLWTCGTYILLKEKEDDMKRYADLLEKVEDAKRRRAAAEAPAMPVVAASAAGNRQPRVRVRKLLEGKLVSGVVARVVSQSEMDQTLEPKRQWMRSGRSFGRKPVGWKKRFVSVMTLPRRHARATRRFTSDVSLRYAHKKGAQVPDGDPNKKWKGSGVFRRNRVPDEHRDHALFAELGSSPASMESGKILDAYGLWLATRLLEAAGGC